MQHDSYLRTLFTRKDRKKAAMLLAKEIRAVVKRGELEFDAFACIGVSGLGMASILADKLNKDLIVVRKSGEDSHSYLKVEGPEAHQNGMRYLFVDDFTSSGATFRTVLQALNKHEDGLAHKCMGSVLYQSLEGGYHIPRILRDYGTAPTETRHSFGALVASWSGKQKQTKHETYVPSDVEDGY